jgi:hypothetical protein
VVVALGADGSGNVGLHPFWLTTSPGERGVGPAT